MSFKNKEISESLLLRLIKKDTNIILKNKHIRDYLLYYIRKYKPDTLDISFQMEKYEKIFLISYLKKDLDKKYILFLLDNNYECFNYFIRFLFYVNADIFDLAYLGEDSKENIINYLKRKNYELFFGKIMRLIKYVFSKWRPYIKLNTTLIWFINYYKYINNNYINLNMYNIDKLFINGKYKYSINFIFV